jgi:hypothetical protein
MAVQRQTSLAAQPAPTFQLALLRTLGELERASTADLAARMRCDKRAAQYRCAHAASKRFIEPCGFDDEPMPHGGRRGYLWRLTALGRQLAAQVRENDDA